MQPLVLGRDLIGRSSVVMPTKLRTRHLYVLGKSGAGKSALLKRLILQDAKAQNGPAVAVFDAGDLVLPDLLELLPDSLLSRVVPFTVNAPLPYNPFLRERGEPAKLENELFALLDQVVAEGSSTAPLSARMKRVLSAAIRAILAEPAPTFCRLVAYLLENKETLRRSLELREDEFSATWEAVIDRLSGFTRDPRIRRVICAGHELDFKRIVDERKILLVSLAGIEPALRRFLGTLLFSGLQATVLQRAIGDRSEVAVYVDEFQDYIASSYAVANFQQLFAQGRRYGIGLTVAHQDFATIDRALLHTIHGNAAGVVSFACGPEESRRMSQIFGEAYQPHQIAFLADHAAVVRAGDKVWPIATYPPPSRVRRVTDTAWEGEDPPDPAERRASRRDHDDRKPLRPTVRRKAPPAAPTSAPEGNPA